jgi:hypothetical protein
LEPWLCGNSRHGSSLLGSSAPDFGASSDVFTAFRYAKSPRCGRCVRRTTSIDLPAPTQPAQWGHR